MNLNISPVNFGKLHIKRDKETRAFVDERTHHIQSRPQEWDSFENAMAAIDCISGSTDVYMRYNPKSAIHKNRGEFVFSLDKYDDNIGKIATVDYFHKDADRDKNPEQYYKEMVRSFKGQFKSTPECTKKIAALFNRYV